MRLSPCGPCLFKMRARTKTETAAVLNYRYTLRKVLDGSDLDTRHRVSSFIRLHHAVRPPREDCWSGERLRGNGAGMTITTHENPDSRQQTNSHNLSNRHHQETMQMDKIRVDTVVYEEVRPSPLD